MTRLMGFIGAAACAAFIGGSATAWAADTPTAAQCNANYASCDAACNAADPKHGFCYAGCSAKCVAKKAACDSEIVYDKSADWTKKQYDAAKPWVQEKARQTEKLIDEAPAHTERTYPSQN